MDLLTIKDLKVFAERADGQAAVSMFMPTHRFGSDASADPVRWKNLVGATADALSARNMHKTDIDALLGPATSLLSDAMTWQHMSDGLALHVQPGWHRMSRVPFPVPEVATVGDRLAVSPLLRATSRGSHFLILTVSQRRVRLLEATQDSVEEVELRDLPTSLRDVVDAPEPRSDAMARSLAGGSSGPAVFYGHGAADDQFKTEETRKFLRQVTAGLHDLLAGQHLPMVLVGLDANTAIFRDVNTYRHVVDEAVRQNPDQRSAPELHALAWPIVAERLAAVRAGLAQRFEALNGTGQASADADQIVEAAGQGRVETLFIATEPWPWQLEAGSGSPIVVDLDAARAGAVAERFVQLERAAVATMAAGGDVYTVADATVPGGGQIAATFRY